MEAWGQRGRPGIMSATFEDDFREPLKRFAMRYLGNEHDAEDAVQEVQVRILEAKTKPDDLRVWSYRVARNVCLNRLRSSGRRKDVERLMTGVNVPVDQVGELTRLVRAEDGVALGEALAQLSDAQREVLVLRYLEGLGRDEIARVLELPVSVVKSRLYEGVTKLRG